MTMYLILKNMCLPIQFAAKSVEIFGGTVVNEKRVIAYRRSCISLEVYY